VHPAHEVVEVLAAGGHRQAGVEQIQQPGLATADRPPEIETARRLVRQQRRVAGLQAQGGGLLGGIGQAIALGQGVVVGGEGGRVRWSWSPL